MNMKYETPVIEIASISTEDIIMVSPMDVQDSGTCPTVDWTSF